VRRLRILTLSHASPGYRFRQGCPSANL
jgi:hypothetical protein